jgi:hypothetical protein
MFAVASSFFAARRCWVSWVIEKVMGSCVLSGVAVSVLADECLDRLLCDMGGGNGALREFSKRQEIHECDCNEQRQFVTKGCFELGSRLNEPEQ